MNVDADMAPLLTRMSAAMQRIHDELLPLLEQLDEDTLVSHYTLAEQARVNLSAAFAMAFALYALDKLSNRRPPSLSSSGASAAAMAAEGSSSSSTRTEKESMTVLTGGGAVDAQLVLKIERITDYIRKLRDIAQLQASQQQQQQQRQQQQQEAVATTNNNNDKALRKRARDDDDTTTTTTAATSDTTTRGGDKDGDVLGDAALFAVVTRTPARVGGAVQQLMRHVAASATEATTTSAHEQVPAAQDDKTSDGDA